MPRRWPVLVPAACLLCLAGLTGCSAGGVAATSSPSLPARTDAAPVEPLAAVVLRDWDARRSAAYAAGSVPLLRSLYLPGSTAGRSDIRILRRYVERGLVVDDMRMQILALEVLQRTPRLWRLRVTDRLVGAAARGFETRLPLPMDRPTTRVVTLRRVDGDWRMGSVSAEGRPKP